MGKEPPERRETKVSGDHRKGPAMEKRLASDVGEEVI